MTKIVSSIYYVYGNISYSEIIENYLKHNFSVCYPLNISSSSGCGFKIETSDMAALKNLDVFLESCEGWIQSSRRNDFNELETDILDFDKYYPKCTYRLTTRDRIYLNFITYAHKGLIVIKRLNFLGGSTTGDYIIYLGYDYLSGGVLANSTLTIDKYIKKTLADNDFIRLDVTNCQMTGAIVEFDTQEDRVLTVFDNGYDAVTDWLPVSTDISKIIDWDWTTPQEFRCGKGTPMDKWTALELRSSVKDFKYFVAGIAVKSTDTGAYVDVEDCYHNTTRINALAAPTYENWVQVKVAKMPENTLCQYGEGGLIFKPYSPQNMDVFIEYYIAFFIY